MPIIIIQGTPIDFPNTGASPVWSEAVDQFAVAVADAIATIVGTYDISPQQFVLDAVPNSVDTNIPNLSFAPSVVRGALISYSVYRNTNSTTVSETGVLTINYNGSNGSGSKWEMTREAAGNSQVTFSISDAGQVIINTTAIAGTSYNGTISYFARALQVTY